MGAVTIQTSIPTDDPSTLGTGIAPLISTSQIEVVIDISDDISGAVRYRLLRWNEDAAAWFPVVGGELEVLSDPTVLSGLLGKVIDNPGRGYYCLLQTSTGTISATAALSALLPISKDFRSVTEASDTLLDTDRIVAVDYAGAVGIAIPDSFPEGVELIVYDDSGAAGGNNITLTPDGAQSFNNGVAGAPFVMNVNDARVSLIRRGLNWNLKAA